MKKARAILFLLLALFFFSKSFVSYAADYSKSICCAIDFEDNESTEKNEKDPFGGKEKCENWIIGQSIPVIRSDNSQFFFRFRPESGFITPYFEISSPPPDLNLLS